jgi:hypothetical protein
MSQTMGERTSVLAPPYGLDQIRATFGEIFTYILPDHTLDPRWETQFLTRIDLPFRLRLSWDKSRLVKQMTCHKLVAPIFTKVFAKLQSAGLQQKITSFGGCFSFRPQRSGTKLSTHAWGIAIDVNPETNQQGTAGELDSAIIAILKQAGFSWGGDWQGHSRDPMHFQYCSGY